MCGSDRLSLPASSPSLLLSLMPGGWGMGSLCEWNTSSRGAYCDGMWDGGSISEAVVVLYPEANEAVSRSLPTAPGTSYTAMMYVINRDQQTASFEFSSYAHAQWERRRGLRWQQAITSLWQLLRCQDYSLLPAIGDGRHLGRHIGGLPSDTTRQLVPFACGKGMPLDSFTTLHQSHPTIT